MYGTHFASSLNGVEVSQNSGNTAKPELTRYTITSENPVNTGATTWLQLDVWSHSSQRFKFEFYFSEKADGGGARFSEQSVILEPGQENSSRVYFSSKAFSSECPLYLIGHFSPTNPDQDFEKDEFGLKLSRSKPAMVAFAAPTGGGGGSSGSGGGAGGGGGGGGHVIDDVPYTGP